MPLPVKTGENNSQLVILFLSLMAKRTHSFIFRLTEQEHDLLKKSAKTCASISTFVRNAIRNYHENQGNIQLDLIEKYLGIIQKYDRRLALLESNLNQSVRRVHEVVNAGLASENLLREELLPSVYKTEEGIEAIRSDFTKLKETLQS